MNLKRNIEVGSLLLRQLVDLVMRFTIAFVFIESGLGKFAKLDQVIEFFDSLHIPFAKAQAPMVAGMEILFGALVGLGLFTRIASVPLVGIMIVAIVTAKLPEIEGVSSLLGQIEFLYIVILLGLLRTGSGLLSVDQLLRNKFPNHREYTEHLI